jgi:hypothetical protein
MINFSFKDFKFITHTLFYCLLSSLSHTSEEKPGTGPLKLTNHDVLDITVSSYNTNRQLGQEKPGN